MQTTTILYLIIALLLSISIAYFQYYFKVKNKIKVTPILFVLKILSIFLLMLLFINPKISTTEITNIRPVLSVLVDNSKSIPFFKDDENVADFINKIDENTALQTKFNVQKFTFGNALQVLDTVSFSSNQTNISKALLGINDLFKDTISPVILMTDGNQTMGSDYEFINFKKPIYPVVFGDTTKYTDVKIAQLNVNKYSYIKNKFPVEIILNYEGSANVTSQFTIVEKGKTVFRKNIRFSAENTSETIIANVTSTKEGLQYYTANIAPLENEKNIKNNSKSFSVEVIDEQTKVLLLTSIIHPDIGALKNAIESNKQRAVSIVKINDFKEELADYQLVILYQPTNAFSNVFADIKQNNSNYLLISGANTAWNFINNQQLGFSKNAINSTENYSAFYNDSFLTFLQADIGFNNFPPLVDKFGEIQISKEHQTLFYQTINGVQLQQPLLATFDVNNQKSAVLFGEGIWKWRAASFLNSNSFEDFDTFIGNLTQYLASNKKRNRLEVNSENIYPANSSINIAAFYTDKNYQFDARAALEITITNSETNNITKVPFSLVNNSYQTTIENLASGDYTFKVSVLGQNITKNGSFKITAYQIEEQFTNAAVNKLQKLADKTSGKLFFKNQNDALIDELLQNERFYTTQKSTVKQQNLIDWKWILFIVIALFSAEWLLRKYHGKI